jgi:hypothetical protein
MKDMRLSTLDVAGSIPVSRSSFQELSRTMFNAVSISFQRESRESNFRPHRKGIKVVDRKGGGSVPAQGCFRSSHFPLRFATAN